MENIITKTDTSKNLFPLIIIVSSLALYVTSLHHFLLFHYLVELFTIVIAFGIFAIAWTSRRYVNNNFLLILGIGLFFIASLDLLHTLSYKGTEIFADHTSNLPTQLWIAARYLTSISFLIAVSFLGKEVGSGWEKSEKKISLLFFLYAAVFVLIILSIFYWKIFPTAFIEGVGQTRFKINSEYLISILFLASIFILIRRRKFLDTEIFNLVSFSLILKIAAEISFTEYASVYDFSNALGHIFRFISYLILYRAVLEIGLMQPYRFLFLDLKKSQEEYRVSQEALQGRIEDHLTEAYEHLGLANRKISLLLEVEEHGQKKEDKQTIIGYILNSIQSACHAKVAMLYQGNRNGNFSLVLSRGMDAEKVRELQSVSLEEVDFLKKMAVEKKRINSPCQLMDPGCFNLEKLSYFVAIPFMAKNEFSGFVYLGFENRRSMDTSELEFLDVFSIHASKALAKLKVIRAT